MTRRRSAEDVGLASGPVTFNRIDAWRVAIPMLEPFRISSGEVSRKEAVIVRVNEGTHFGWGETSAMPGSFYSVDTPDSCQSELTGQVLPALIGRSFPHMHYRLRGVHVSLILRWDFEAPPPGAGDTELALFRGTRSSVEVRQGATEKYRPEAFLIPARAEKFLDISRN